MIPVAKLIAVEYPIYSYEVNLYNKKEKKIRPTIYVISNVENDYMFLNSCREITEYETQVVVEHLKEVSENLY